MNRDADSSHFPKWEDCDLFCIREYAGAGGSSCGWRGRVEDRRIGGKNEPLCPRCGHATLLKVPADGGNPLPS